jgi:hypothetical protein
MMKVDPKYAAKEKLRQKRRKAVLAQFNRDARSRAKANSEKWEKVR